MKRVSIVFLAAVFLTASLAGSASAASVASIWQRNTGDGPGLWSDSANWDAVGGVPVADTTVVRTAKNAALLAEMQVTGDQTIGLGLRHGYNDVVTTQGPLLRIMNGGTLSQAGGTRVYLAYTSNADMTIDAGGAATFTHRLYVGQGLGTTANLDISGTLNVLNNNLYVGNDGIGLISVLDGGVLNLGAPGRLLFTGAAGSRLDLFDTGKIVFAGSVRGGANGLLPSIYGDGLLGNVETNYDAGLDVTTITVIPEPATMILLGLGGLLIRKRR